MAMYQTEFVGEDYVGLFGFATDKYLLVSPRLSDNHIDNLVSHLSVPVVRSSVSGFFLSGIMSSGNSNGVLLPYLALDSEISSIGEKTQVSIVPDRFTALGNLIVANDYGGVISDVFSQEAKAIIDKTLGVKTVQMRIANSSEVGAVCLSTNKGFVVTPDAGDDEIKKLSGIFGVEGGRATANTGSKLIGACLIANSRGFVAGSSTTPLELEYITEALGFL